MIHVLFLHAAEYAYQTSALIESINRSVDMRAALCTQWEVDHLENYIGSDVDIVVTVHSRGMIVETITAFCRKNEVVTVTLQDGIMDYKHWTVVAPDRYNPLLTDYIFVFGEASRRLLIDREVDESKIIVTGCPRFDQYVTTERNDRYVLITCANTPYHILREKVSLFFIFFRLICHCKMSGTPFRLRLPGKLKKSLMFRFLSLLLPRNARLERSLAEDIAGAMCVCTTMSTLVLESLCHRKPVILIKNHSYPYFINFHNQLSVFTGRIQPKPLSTIRFNGVYEKVLFDNVAFLGESTIRVADMLRQVSSRRPHRASCIPENI